MSLNAALLRFSVCDALTSIPLNKGQLLAMLTAVPLTLSPISARLSCGWCLATPNQAVTPKKMTPCGCTAWSPSFGLSCPGELQGQSPKAAGGPREILSSFL